MGDGDAGRRAIRPRSEEDAIELLTPGGDGRGGPQGDRQRARRASVLMERAGAAVAAAAARWRPRAGGSPCWRARATTAATGSSPRACSQEAGYAVSVFLRRRPRGPEGRRELMAQRWTGPVAARLAVTSPTGADLIIDALFGAGLDRPVEGVAAEAIDGRQRKRRADPCGRPAERRRRPAPARSSGRRSSPARPSPSSAGSRAISCCRAGCSPDRSRSPTSASTLPCLDDHPPRRPSTTRRSCGWPDCPQPRLDGHKYDRGPCPRRVGAADRHRRGAARRARRAPGRGRAWSRSPRRPMRSWPMPRSSPRSCSSASTRPRGSPRSSPTSARTPSCSGRRSASATPTAAMVGAALGSEAAVVIDADGLTSFADDPEALFAQIRVALGSGGAHPP